MKHRSLSLTAGVLVVTFAGCHTPTQREARLDAEQRWNVARAEVKAQLAAEQFAAGELDTASKELGEARRLDPENVPYQLLEARLALSNGNSQQAERLLEKLAADRAVAGECRYLLGMICEQRLEWADALRHYRSAMELTPGQIEYVVAAAQAMLQLGQPNKALELLARQEESLGWTPAYHAAVAETHEQLGEWAAAAAAWRRVAEPDGDVAVLERLALAQFRAEQWSTAADSLDLLLTQSPQSDSRAVRLALAECLLNSGNVEGARQAVSELLRESPQDIRASQLLAHVLAAGGHYARGLSVTEDALRIAPRDAGLLELGAVLALRAAQPTRAAELADQLRRLDGQRDNVIAGRVLAQVRPG